MKNKLLCCEKGKHFFNIDDASLILEFKINNVNKNLKINNYLFNKNLTKILLNKVKKIKNYYEDYKRKDHEKLLDEFLKFIKCNINDISLKEKDFDEKLISFMIIEHEALYSQTPRVIQIICLLFYLEGHKKKYNLILQVLSGEGKTLTISLLALYLSIIGNKVDILTSSPVLAERDSINRKKFYERFEIKCDYCRKGQKDEIFDFVDKKFECYKADIIYGDSLNLIGDVLRTEFMGQKGRGNRPFDYIIIDEIDNICIDNLRNTIELIDNFPGYKYLEYLYLFIYKTLKEHTDKYLDKKKELKKKAELIIHNVSMETRKFLYVNKALYFNDEEKILIPENSYDFINSRIEHWSKMAYDAMFNFEKDKNYFISKDNTNKFITLKPIDYENTGVILQNSIWSGLHQFLQIKEGLTLTEENINSSFMSYISFFKKFKMINGITGTLGSKKTQQAINRIYNINLLAMPSFKDTSLQIFEPRVFSDETMFKEKLINEIIEYSVHSKRAVLVLFEYISQVKEMSKYLFDHKKDFKLNETKIIPYYRSDIENKFLEERLKPNTVIISTNLSGRGTDIKISQDVNQNGGLHVIITFMPYNERTERQAQGRAGRCGEKGSSVILIHAKNDYDTLKKRREKYELEQYKFLINLYVPQADLNQKFFEKFCNKLKEIEHNNLNIGKNIISDLKERWSMFILKNNINLFMNDSINVNCSRKVYKLYERITTQNFNALMKEIENYTIKDYNFYNSFNQMKKDLPKKMYESSISKNPYFSIGAYYNLAYSDIENQVDDCPLKVKDNLNKLSEICEKFICQYQKCINLFNEIHKGNKIYYRDFINQFEDKKKVMKIISKNIEDNLRKTRKIIELGSEKMKIANKFEINKIKTDFKPSKNILEYFSDFGINFLFEIDRPESARHESSDDDDDRQNHGNRRNRERSCSIF